jgi:hypothetical protein
MATGQEFRNSGIQEFRNSGIDVDFRCIMRFESDLPELGNYLLNELAVEERRIVIEKSGINHEMYERLEDNSQIILKSIDLLDPIGDRVIENLIHLRHPCISVPICFAFP